MELRCDQRTIGIVAYRSNEMAFDDSLGVKKNFFGSMIIDFFAFQTWTKQMTVSNKEKIRFEQEVV